MGRNVLIASWNLREFGGLTERRLSRGQDTPKRDLFSLRVIADIVSRFDVIALQELQGSIKALRHLLEFLGPEWAFMLTDVTKGDRGQNERLAFVFDTRRLKPSGLACELVVPDDVLAKRPVKPDALYRQFARTPYAVSFLGSGQTFILVTLHVWFGSKPAERFTELGCIAEWLSDWAGEVTDFNQNLIALGDFNIDRKGDPNYEAFVSKGLSPPPDLDGLPRTLPTKSTKPKFFDQIAWFNEGGHRKLSLDYRGSAGHFEFNRHVLPGLSRDEVSFRISDHYPCGWSCWSLDPPTSRPGGRRHAWAAAHVLSRGHGRGARKRVLASDSGRPTCPTSDLSRRCRTTETALHGGSA